MNALNYQELPAQFTQANRIGKHTSVCTGACTLLHQMKEKLTDVHSGSSAKPAHGLA